MTKEIKLNPRLIITSFKKLKNALKGENPEVIRVTIKQYHEYHNLFPKSSMKSINDIFMPLLTFEGAKLLLHTKLFTGFDRLSK